MSASRAASAWSALSRYIGDWTLLAPALTLSLLGIATMHTFGQGASLAPRQLLWLAIAVVIYLTLSLVDVRFIRRTPAVLALYGLSAALFQRDILPYGIDHVWDGEVPIGQDIAGSSPAGCALRDRAFVVGWVELLARIGQ